jgi:hypothetical protein
VTREERLEAIATVTGEVLREEFPERADLCVLATRIGFDACKYFGIGSRPVVVRTLVFNVICRTLREGGWRPESVGDEFASGEAWALAVDENDRGRCASRGTGAARADEGFLLDPRVPLRAGRSSVVPDVLVVFPTWPRSARGR